LADIVVFAPQRRSSYRTAPRFLAGIVKWSIALLLFLAVLSISQRSVGEVVSTHLAELPRILWAPTAFGFLVIVQLVYLYRAWSGGYWWPSRRLHYSLLCFAQAGLPWAFWYWSMMSPQVLAFIKP